MPRQPDQPLTEDDKFKIQLQHEQELGSLQRQYHLLEKDRTLWDFKGGRLGKILLIFQKEHDNILTDLDVATSSTKKNEDKRDSQHLSKLIEEHDEYEDDLKKERTYIKEIEGQVQRMEKDVVKLRSMQVTDRHQEDRIRAALSTSEGLLNKLDVQNKKFGTICAKNREMKLEIGRMLWERDVFMKIWNKLITQLVIGKKYMMDLIEQATIAYDQREQWVSKLQALRIKAHQDLVMHIQTMRELKRKQDNDKKLKEFFNTKGQKRVMRDLEENRMFKRMENKIRMKEGLKRHRQYLDDIKEFTRETKIEAIVKKYHRQEAENFSLFNQVNNIMEDMEYLCDDLDNLHKNIDAENEETDLANERGQEELKNLESDLEVATKELEDTKNELQDIEQYINSMLEGTMSLFKLCRCNQDPVLKLLGDNTSINVYNFSFFVEMIEQTVDTALVEVYHYEKIAYEKKKITSNDRVIYEDRIKRELKSLEKQVDSTPCPLCVEHEVVSDVIDTLQHALSRQQAQQVLTERLNQPEFPLHVHTVSKCFLPKSRELIQKRYQ